MGFFRDQDQVPLFWSRRHFLLIKAKLFWSWCYFLITLKMGFLIRAPQDRVDFLWSGWLFYQDHEAFFQDKDFSISLSTTFLLSVDHTLIKIKNLSKIATPLKKLKINPTLYQSPKSTQPLFIKNLQNLTITFFKNTTLALPLPLLISLTNS